MMRKVYMGWDPREQAAYAVAENSILRQSLDTEVVPLKLSELPMLTRPIERRDGRLWCPISEAPMATEFAISRFCVPFIQREGWALFTDCDVLCMDDMWNLFRLADPRYAVMVVKHDQRPAETTKMDGQVQTVYARKNWSSVVLWNCGHPAHERLTLEALNSWPGRDLHAFKWLEDSEIGDLPVGWNYLVNVNPVLPAAMIHMAHFTLGTPDMRSYKGGLADQWWREHERCCVAAG
jgi:hypothetical protein